MLSKGLANITTAFLPKNSFQEITVLHMAQEFLLYTVNIRAKEPTILEVNSGSHIINWSINGGP